MPAVAQPLGAAARHVRVGIEAADDHARDPGFEDRVDAGRRAARVVARLERDVERRRPRPASPAARERATSACSSPARSWMACADDLPSFATTTAPTGGLGEGHRLARASSSASAHHRTSSARRQDWLLSHRRRDLLRSQSAPVGDYVRGVDGGSPRASRAFTSLPSSARNSSMSRKER